MVLGFGRKRDEAILHWQAEVKFWKQQLDKCVHEKNYVLTMCYGAQRELKVQEARSLLLQEQVRQQAMQLELLQHKLNQAAALRSAASTEVSTSLPVYSSVAFSPRPEENAACKMLEVQLASCQTRLKDSEMELVKAEEKVDHLTQALEQTKAELACAQSTVAAYETESEQLRNQLAAARGLGDDTAGQAAWLAQQLSEAHAATQQLRAEVTMKEQMISIMQMQLRGSTYSSGENTPLGSYAPSNATFGPMYGATYRSNGGGELSGMAKEQLEQLRMSISQHAYGNGAVSDMAQTHRSGLVSAGLTPRDGADATNVSVVVGSSLPYGMMNPFGGKDQASTGLQSASMQAHGIASLPEDAAWSDMEQQPDAPLNEEAEMLLWGSAAASQQNPDTEFLSGVANGNPFNKEHTAPMQDITQRDTQQEHDDDVVGLNTKKQQYAPDVEVDVQHADQPARSMVQTPVRGLVNTENAVAEQRGGSLSNAAAERSTVEFAKVLLKRSGSVSSDRSDMSDRVTRTPSWNQMLRPTNKQKSAGNVQDLGSTRRKQEEVEDFNVSNIIAKFGSKQGGAVVPIPLYGEGSKSMRIKPAVHPVARTGASGAEHRIPSITAAAPATGSSPAMVS